MTNKVTAETPVPDHVLADHRVRKCTGTCGRMTRGHNMTLEDFPATVYRTVGDMCQKCRNDLTRDSPETIKRAEAKFARTLDSLNAWNARREWRLSRAGRSVNA